MSEETEELIEKMNGVLNSPLHSRKKTWVDRIPFLVWYGLFVLASFISAIGFMAVNPVKVSDMVEINRAYTIEYMLALILFLVSLISLGSFIEKLYQAYQQRKGLHS